MQFIQNVYWTFAPVAMVEIVRVVVMILLLLAGFWLTARVSPRWRLLVSIVMMVMSLRLVLLDNPIAWAIYRNIFTAGDVGWRERGVANFEARKTRALYDQPPLYLAVGSSQIDAVFSPVRDRSLQVLSLAGMAPLDFLLYQRWIARVRPGIVILFLSEFDIARLPPFDTARFANVDLAGMRAAYHRLVAEPAPPGAGEAFIQLAISQLFPEYRYSFVFRGMRDHLSFRKRLLDIREAEEIPDAEQLAQQLVSLDRNLVAEPISYNLDLLSAFIAYCQKEGIRVVVVEGQYHPRGYTAKNIALNGQVRAGLTALSVSQGFRFMPRERTYEFGEGDYRDGYHVTREAGVRYTVALLKVIEAESSLGDVGAKHHGK